VRPKKDTRKISPENSCFPLPYATCRRAKEFKVSILRDSPALHQAARTARTAARRAASEER